MDKLKFDFTKNFNLTKKQIWIISGIVIALVVISVVIVLLRVQSRDTQIAPTSSSAGGDKGVAGSVPPECTTISSENPMNDPSCNESCSDSSCISYCKDIGNGAKIRVNGDFNTLRISYSFVAKSSLTLLIPELNIQKTFNCDSACVLSEDFDVSLKGGDIITVQAKLSGKNGIGFRAPTGNLCGEGNICREDNNGFYANMDISPLQEVAYSDGFVKLSEQCWGDYPSGSADFDFNDGVIILSAKNVENICEAGEITNPPDSLSFAQGQPVIVKGWASDADGIDVNSIKVLLDGSFIGNATVTGDSEKGANAKSWSYSLDTTGLIVGSHTISVEWADLAGNSGGKGNNGCADSVTIVITPARDTFDIADVSVTKQATVSCNSDGSEATVDVTMRVIYGGNTDSVNISSITDSYTNKINSSWVVDSSITPSGATVSSSGVEWDRNFIIDSRTGLTLGYKMIVPKAYFGSYSSKVSVNINGDAVTDSNLIDISCTPTSTAQTTPSTGIFDSDWKVGVILLIGGFTLVVLSTQVSIFEPVFEGINMYKTKRANRNRRTRVVVGDE